MNSYSSAVDRARALDAEGRHDDAINELAAAAQASDIEATTQLAKRIIVGDRAPRLPQQGISLLQDAVGLGGAEAAERLAIIAVSGIAGAPDWQAALRLLGLAAERGWTPALSQLEVLASMSRDAAGASHAIVAARTAGELLAAIDLKELLKPGAGNVVHADPHIRSFPNFLNDSACDWLINRARPRLTRALVYDVVSQTSFADSSRTNSYAVFNRMEADMVQLMIQARMSVACGQPISHMEAPTVLHYAIGEEIGNHYDFVDPAKPSYAEDVRRFGHRVITFLIYLNEGYQGGETQFPKLGVSHSGRRGEGLFFVNVLPDDQADVRTLHGGRPPIAREKWVFSQFIRNRPELVVR